MLRFLCVATLFHEEVPEEFRCQQPKARKGRFDHSVFFQVRGSSTRSTTHEDCCTWLRAHEEVPESSVPDSQKSERAVSVPASDRSPFRHAERKGGCAYGTLVPNLELRPNTRSLRVTEGL